jgi:aspartate aminotransferase-like enzyme
LGGAPVRVDELGIDACYSGTQKCLGCSPGLSPVTFNERAIEGIRQRKTKVQSWYLDLSMIEKYWGSERVYHHTAPISMNYALHEALRIVLEEGLAASWQRHKQTHEVFIREMRKLEIAGGGRAIRADDQRHRFPKAPMTPRCARLYDSSTSKSAVIGRQRKICASV